MRKIRQLKVARAVYITSKYILQYILTYYSIVSHLDCNRELLQKDHLLITFSVKLKVDYPQQSLKAMPLDFLCSFTEMSNFKSFLCLNTTYTLIYLKQYQSKILDYISCNNLDQHIMIQASFFMVEDAEDIKSFMMALHVSLLSRICMFYPSQS